MCNLSSNLGLFPSGKAIDHHLGLDESILFKRADVVQVTGEGYRKFKESFLFGKLGTPVGGSHFGKGLGPADWRGGQPSPSGPGVVGCRHGRTKISVFRSAFVDASR